MRDIGGAFSFVFRDPEWPMKLLGGAFFTLLSIVLIGIPVLYGYLIELLQRVRRGELSPLPEWKDPGVKFISGLKYLLAVFVYVLPVMVLYIPLIFIVIASTLYGSETGEVISTAALIVFLVLFAVPYSVFIGILMPFLSIRFAERESISDVLQLKSVLVLFKNHWQDAVIVFLIQIGLSLAAGLGILLLIVGMLFTSFYVSLVQFHLYGQIGQSVDTGRVRVS